LALWRIFSTKIQSKNSTWTYHKTVIRSTEPAITPNRCYQLPFFSVVLLSVHFTAVLVLWLGGSFAKLGFGVGMCGFANVPPIALAFLFV
jgi:hypothetical protein